MSNVTVLSQEGKKIKDITLNPDVFGIEFNKQVVFDAIVMQQATNVKRQLKPKNVLKFVVVVENHGVKKELVALVKDLFVLHNGVVVGSYLVQLVYKTLN